MREDQDFAGKNTTDDSFRVSAPQISLPKGGGALRGIGKKFAANPVTGNGSMTVPIATSPGRAGFGPQLALSYDSGAGSGPFGFGWSLSLPGITRKTEKGLPRYADAEESDVFILSGAEDLVPAYRRDRDGTWTANHPGFVRDITSFWVYDKNGNLVVHEDEIDGYRVRRYRPRIEGLFARIERWTNIGDATDVHWRSFSKDNVLTIYGADGNSRIVDPTKPRRIFSWFICESRDDKGNGILYRYKEEDGVGVDLSCVSERNRGSRDDVRRSANRYLKRVYYGNKATLLDEAARRPRFLTDRQLEQVEWLFEVVFDYGDHDGDAPRPDDDSLQTKGVPKFLWGFRQDPFSSYRAGFEVRTTRLCRRVLMFHHFRDEAVGVDCLVRSTDFTYSFESDPDNTARPVYTFLEAVTQSSYVRDGDIYLKRSLPPVEFDYTQPTVDRAVKEVDSENLDNLPVGLDGATYQWTDLHGEGIPGILTEQARAWFYKRNLSSIAEGSVKFAPTERVALKPNQSVSSGQAQFMDLAGDGQPDLVVLDGPMPGLYEHDDVDESWQPFRPFECRLNRDTRDPNLRLVDLDGDGQADVLVTEHEAFVWHASLGESGFGSAHRVAQEFDEEKGPRLVFADETESIFLADLSGDGLTDLVRIRNGEVCYWPNLGYSRFGAKISMDRSPWFDNPDQFDHQRLRLADIDGSGTTDLIYLHRDGVRIYFNQSGNAWGQPLALMAFPRVDDLVDIVPLDLFGNGTACLVWSSPLASDTRRQMRYVDLMGGQKPHLLIKTRNNLGAMTAVEYAPSTKFYLQDKVAGRPWVTRLPFPVHVAEKVTITDQWRRTTFTTTYSYHHGYFDGVEREFRGFGRVEQIDTEDYGTVSAKNASSPFISDKTLYQPPVKTVTWFHTGAFLDRERILTQFAHEYFPTAFEDQFPALAGAAFQENELPEPDLAAQAQTSDEWREALRACKGMLLRQESYELDVRAMSEGKQQPVKLFSTAYHNCHIECLQPQSTNRHAVFFLTESEAITYRYELDLTTPLTPDPRVAHTLNLLVDDLGQVLQSVTVAYPRLNTFADMRLSTSDVELIRAVQSELHLAYVETRYTDDVDDDDNYRLRMPCEVQTYELTGIGPEDASDKQTTDPRDNLYFSIDELRAYRLSEIYQTAGTPVSRLEYQEWPDGTAQKRVVEHVRTLYFDDSGAASPAQALNFGRHGPRGLKYEDYRLAITKNLLAQVFDVKLDTTSFAVDSARDLLNDKSKSGYWPGTTFLQILQTDPGKSGYWPDDPTDQYWMCSGIAEFASDATQQFFLPTRYTDPFGAATDVTFDSYNLSVTSTKDMRDNEVRVTDFDFRVLAPAALQDANGNISRAAFDAIGMPVAIARERGGDSVSGLTPAFLNPAVGELVGFFTATPYSEVQPRVWLAQATTRFVYHFGETVDGNGNVLGWEARPAAACSIQRETHVADLDGAQTTIQVAIEYSDGSGNVLVKKAQAEPDPDSTLIHPPMRWIASGKIVLNNKAKAVKQYEPYFSSTDHRFDPGEAQAETGVTSIMYYDAPGRLIRTEMPDGTFSRIEFSPWYSAAFDQNDTVADSRWYSDRGSPRPADSEPSDPAVRAAWLAIQHADTPQETHFDSLGRDVVVVAHNRTRDDQGVWNDGFYVTYTKLDSEGKPLWIRDARKNLMMQYVTPPKANNDLSNAFPAGTTPAYDIGGNLLFQHSMDAGDRWTINDAAGKAMVSWDNNDGGQGTAIQRRASLTEYDELHRPVRMWLKIDDAAPALIEAFEYCDTSQPNGAANLADAQQRNLVGQSVKHRDPSGLSTIERVDLSGKSAHLTRTLAKPGVEGANGVLDWAGNGPLEQEVFHQLTDYDALGRITTLYNWHRDITFAGGPTLTPGSTDRVAVYVPQYNERGALRSEWVHMRATKSTSADGRVSFASDAQRSRQAISNITYNAKGQRLTLELGNGTTTTYTYDDETFRLKTLRTLRTRAPKGLQDLSYVYDPVGNITHIDDAAQETVYTNNTAVRPQQDYVYDALYRLIEATGRENPAAPSPPRSSEDPWPQTPFPANITPRNYTERHFYDSVGNFVKTVHLPSSGAGWTRNYETEADSNRLSKTWYGNDTIRAVTYRHDAHGNILNLNRINTPPPLANEDQWGLLIQWDWRDMIRVFDCIGGGIARYQYGIDKQRIRKYIKRIGTVVEDRIYLGGYELYRRSSAAGVVEEIESHHLSESEQRVLVVDDVIRSSKGGQSVRPDGLTVKAQTLFRYQYSNHLGSACLELDDQAEIISYEEYHPYGTSAYRALKSAIEAPPKRYRYTGMERDEESGLSYHSARHYATWLGRWVSCDPSQFSKTMLTIYTYGKGNPMTYFDPSGLDDKPGLLSRFWTWLNTPTNPDVEEVQRFWQEHTDEVMHEARTSGSWSYLDAMRLSYVMETNSDVQSVPNTPPSFALEVGIHATSVYVGSRNKGVNGEPPENKEPSVPAPPQDVSTSSQPSAPHATSSADVPPPATLPPSAPSSATPPATAPSSATPPKNLERAFRRDQVRVLRALPEDDPVRTALLREDQKGLKTGRGLEDSIGLEAGHLDARSSTKSERLALQDADANAFAGRTIESRNSPADRSAGTVLFSRFDAVEVRPGVFLQTTTFEQYIRLAVLPPEVRSTAKPSQGWTWKPKGN